MHVFVNPVCIFWSEGFREKMENPNRKKVDDYGIPRAWGDNTFQKFRRPGGLKYVSRLCYRIDIFWNCSMGVVLLCPQSTVPFYLRLACIFLHHILKNKAKLSASSAWWPLNRGQNDRTLTRMPKRWQRPLDGGGGLLKRGFTYRSFPEFCSHGTLIFGR